MGDRTHPSRFQVRAGSRRTWSLWNGEIVLSQQGPRLHRAGREEGGAALRPCFRVSSIRHVTFFSTDKSLATLRLVLNKKKKQLKSRFLLLRNSRTFQDYLSIARSNYPQCTSRSCIAFRARTWLCGAWSDLGKGRISAVWS